MGFIHLEAEDYLHQDQLLKKKPKFCPKNFLIKTKISKLMKVGYVDGKLSTIGIHQLDVNGEKLSVDEVEAALYCDELVDAILDHSYCTDQIFHTHETSLNYKM